MSHYHLKGQIVAERNLLKQMLLHIDTRKVSDLDIATECMQALCIFDVPNPNPSNYFE
jgi:hypothetical protein